MEAGGPTGAGGDAASLLVVDDSEANRDALARRLKRRGYRVDTAVDGRDALDQLGRGPYDLVLLDVMMPGVDGLEVLQTVRRTRSPVELPVIMATAKDDGSDVVRALELGANDYVTKPLDFPVVLARVQTQLELRRSVRQVLELEDHLRRRNAELEAANDRMARNQERLRRDLKAASRVQSALLPHPTTSLPNMTFAWAFRPCDELAGDALNVCRLDDIHVAAYVLDVSGHGVAPALLAVTVTRLLSPAAGQDSLLLQPGDGGHSVVPPAEVADRLAVQFPFDPATEQFFTLAYAVLDVTTGGVRYVSAGHPPAVLLHRDRPTEWLDAAGLPVGLGTGYDEQTVRLGPGDRLCLYSDGVPEAMNPAGELFGRDRLLAALERCRHGAPADCVAGLEADLKAWCGSAPPHDDVSILVLEYRPT